MYHLVSMYRSEGRTITHVVRVGKKHLNIESGKKTS